ncbi:TolC family outer membrane protein [Paucibacter sp. M5-1]|uniref:TolC family outer membrane protein n=1 Tax=Paucibacter sp. M5-1 TaxID=3015998 RepID=UPI0022B88662|nr:TolC family outer membrane protein [Paucibacter sp. M5-1]MCZ7883923.1 TolC family outer membrane protein [Paucibacter sp. M5-1]
MRPKTATLLLMMLALLPGLAGAAEDLLQAYAQARTSDPVLAAAEAARGGAREELGQARAPLLPQWTLAWTQEHQRLAGSSEQRSRELQHRISQVLLDFSRMARLRSAQARDEGQQALLQAARQALLVRVAQAYFGVLSASDALATVQANEDAFARQVQQAQARFAAGLGAQVDIEQARTYHALARANTVAARKALLDAREALAEITGSPTGSLKPLSQDLAALPPEAAERDTWVTQALRDNPALRAEQLALSASEQALDAARAAHLPTLSLALESGRHWPPTAGAGSGAGAGRSDTTLGLSLSLPLFAGGATEAQRRQAAYQRDGAREALEQRRRRVVRETLAQFDAVQLGAAQLDSTRSAVEAAGRALAATQTGQELGTRSMTDLLLAIQNQAAAQGAYSQARHQYVLARLQLRQAAGAIDETHLAAVNALLQE